MPLSDKDRDRIEDAINRALEAGATIDEVREECEYNLEIASEES